MNKTEETMVSWNFLVRTDSKQIKVLWKKQRVAAGVGQAVGAVPPRARGRPLRAGDVGAEPGRNESVRRVGVGAGGGAAHRPESEHREVDREQ